MTIKYLRRFSKRLALVVVLSFAAFILFTILIDTHYAILWNWRSYFHDSIVLCDIHVRTRSTSDAHIAIIVVIDRREDLAEYSLAHLTVSCYAHLHGYELILVDFSRNAALRRHCSQADFMFRRHCAVAEILISRSDLEYVLFLDADIGVINPNRFVNEFLESIPGAELVFYERIFNYEIMAGAYFAKRTNFTISFLTRWANYANNLPESFHGTDNGAIHSVFLDLECGIDEKYGIIHKNATWPWWYDVSPAHTSRKDASLPPLSHCERRRVCSRQWHAARDYFGLQLFTSCARAVLGERNAFAGGRVYLAWNYSRGAYFSRDGWLTNNEWSDDDFLLHGWQNRRLNRRMFAGWHAPLDINEITEADLTPDKVAIYCSTPSNASYHIWRYKSSFMRPVEEIRRRIAAEKRRTRFRHLENLSLIDE